MKRKGRESGSTRDDGLQLKIVEKGKRKSKVKKNVESQF